MISVLIPNCEEERIHEVVSCIEKSLHDYECEVIIASDRDRHGKGWAVREALKEAKGDIICFIDGDMDIHPRMIKRLIPFLDDYDIVLGCKQIKGLLSRQILTFLTRIYIKLAFGIGYDTQTGIKMFHRHALSEWESNSFAFDIEIITRASIRGWGIIEVPVEVNKSSRMKLRSIINALKESIKIWWNLFNES